MQIELLIVGVVQTNCYIVSCSTTHKCIVIDPGDEADFILGYVEKKCLTIDKILLTHAHFDHIGAVAPLSNHTNAPVYIHKNETKNLQTVNMQCDFFHLPHIETFAPDFYVGANEKIECGSITLQVLETPGHTAGGISFYSPGVVFTGDTLFSDSIGRTDLPGASYRQLVSSIRQQLLTLPEETVVYCGHGPETLIGREKRTNPFLN